MNLMPAPIVELVDELMAMPGAVAVVLGGSHAVAVGGQWVCNEKRLIEAAGLSAMHAMFAQVPIESGALLCWVDRVAGLLHAPKDEAMPWRG